MSEQTDPLLGEWLREEALNLEKMFSGVPRLNFVEWKRQRDERARTVSGGEA
jgi:hypothetical protein